MRELLSAYASAGKNPEVSRKELRETFITIIFKPYILGSIQEGIESSNRVHTALQHCREVSRKELREDKPSLVGVADSEVSRKELRGL